MENFDRAKDSQFLPTNEAVKRALEHIEAEKLAAKKKKIPPKKDNRNVGVIAYEASTMACDTMPIYFTVNTAGICETVEKIISFYQERIDNKETKETFGKCFRFAFLANLHRFLCEQLDSVRITPYQSPLRWFRLPHSAYRIITALSSFAIKDSGFPRIYPDGAAITTGVQKGLKVDRLDDLLLQTALGKWDNLITFVARDKSSCWYDKPNKDDRSLLVCGVYRRGSKAPYDYYAVAPFKLARSDELLCAMMRLRRFHKIGAFYEPEYLPSERDGIPQMLSYMVSSRHISYRHFLNEYLSSELRDG